MMPVSPDIWKMLAGLAIFMLGMNFLEEGLKQLVGRRFKLFLKKQTSHKLRAVLGGTVVTGILQSSSVVNLMVLAFVGAGVITMQNALAVILGANFGTTVSSWIVATVGFQYNIENFALPLAGLAGITMMLANKESRLHQWCKLLFGFSFLFIGLNYIKSGIEHAVIHIDLSLLDRQPLLLFLLAGFLITSLIQSSSATVAIVLSALYAQVIGLLAAFAIVLGSEIGTTIKLILASVKGSAAKKRVALGNLLFNMITTIILFLFLVPVHHLITDVIGIKDNLMALVFFQSFVNFTGIILFFPFLSSFGRFLELRFTRADIVPLFIHKVSPADTEPAMAALEKETTTFIYHVAGFTLHAFDKPGRSIPELPLSRDFESKKLTDQYEYIKRLHGDMHNFSIQLQHFITEKEMMTRLGKLISSARNIMYAAKNVKDAFPDIEQLKKSSNDVKYIFFRRTGDRIQEFYEKSTRLALSENPESLFTGLTAVYTSVKESYKQTLQELYKEGLEKKLSEIEFSTILNFNREMYTSQKSIIFALKDLLLLEKQAAYFDELPGFIR